MEKLVADQVGAADTVLAIGAELEKTMLLETFRENLSDCLHTDYI